MSDQRHAPDDPDPYYRTHVFCCTNVRPAGHPRGSCARKNSVQLREYMKSKVKALGLPDIRVNAAGCLDRCELGCTMVIYPEGVWYTYANENDIDEIIDSHIQRGQRVDRLLLAPDQKDLTESQAMNNRSSNP